MFRLSSLLIAGLATVASLAVNSPSQAQQWVHCAAEGGGCDLDGVGIIRYGAGESWRYVVGTNAYSCTIGNSGFDPDPAPGVAKTCQRWVVTDEMARNESMASLQAQLDQAQQQIGALQEQQQYVADLEAEVIALRQELRRFQRGERRERRGEREREREMFGPTFQFGIGPAR